MTTSTLSLILAGLVASAIARPGPTNVKGAAYNEARDTVSGAMKTAIPTDVPSGPTRAVGKLPALGWNSWNAYNCDIDESKVLAAANQFVSLGLKDAGYQFINVDDCWSMPQRDPNTGRIRPDTTKFPDGIDGLASKVHSLGLKFGIYSDAGTATCAGYPGSLEHEELDATTFAEWGVDYLKYDNCNVPDNLTDSSTPPDGDWSKSNTAIRYRRMGDALANVTDHPLVYNLCDWGTANVWDWGAQVGHSWRISGDASPSWSFILDVLDIMLQHLSATGFYGHNDMDMMEIGNGDLTIQEQRTHFAMWAFFKSPILLGTDLGKLNSTQLDIITNRELLAFSQDPTNGGAAAPFAPAKNTDIASPPEFYTGQSEKGTHVFIINFGDAPKDMTFYFDQLPQLGDGNGPFVVHDMWSGKDLEGNYTTKITIRVDPHDTAAVLIRRT